MKDSRLKAKENDATVYRVLRIWRRRGTARNDRAVLIIREERGCRCDLNHLPDRTGGGFWKWVTTCARLRNMELITGTPGVIRRD